MFLEHDYLREETPDLSFTGVKGQMGKTETKF
jgi:hypothetical protein